MNIDAAISAARAESLERGTGHRTTRDRVLESCSRSPRRRLHAVVAAVIASMFGASAFAWYASAPQVPPPRAPVIAPAPTSVTASEPVATAERTVVRIEPVVVEQTDVAADVVESAAPAKPARPAVAPVDIARVDVEPTLAPAEIRGPSQPEATGPSQPASPVRDAELELYATAHQLHFQRRDLPAAIVAWDQYLAATPHGRLAPEARFNRLVALVRLQRWDDAARALDTIDASFRPRDVDRLRAVIRSRAR
jgi:hypothetical protein